MVDTTNQSSKKNIQIKALPNKGGVSGQSAHTLQLNQTASSPRAPENHLPPPTQTVGSPAMSCRAIMPSQTPRQASSPMPASNPPTSPMMSYRAQMSPSMSYRGTVPSQPVPYASVASVAMSGSSLNMTANETSMHYQEAHQFSNQFPQQSKGFHFGGGKQFGSLDQQQRIRLPPYQNGM